MKPEDKFQLIHQHEPGELVFNRNFRGGPRSDDWIVFTITDGLDRGEQAKRRFYKTLVRLLKEGPGVQPAERTPGSLRSPAAAWPAPSSTRTQPPSAAVRADRLHVLRSPVDPPRSTGSQFKAVFRK